MLTRPETLGDRVQAVRLMVGEYALRGRVASVLLAIALRDGNRGCFASATTLGQDIGLSRYTVHRALAELTSRTTREGVPLVSAEDDPARRCPTLRVSYPKVVVSTKDKPDWD